MSTKYLLPPESQPRGSQPLSQRISEVLPWGFYRRKKFANYTREVNEFPNATIPISVSGSAGRLSQLAGITNVAVQVVTGTGFIKKIGVNNIVATGVFSEGSQRIAFGQVANLVCGVVGAFFEGYFAGNALYPNSEAVTLLGNVQQLTTVETVDAASLARLAQLAVIQEHSLMAQLRRLRTLADGWDGENASRISEATSSTAEAVIQQLLEVSLGDSVIPNTHLGPLPDGTLRFECTHSNKELFLTISEKAVEVQKWQPLDSVDSLGYWETNLEGTREHLEWLVK
jgi:hypothetical protein